MCWPASLVQLYLAEKDIVLKLKCSLLVTVHCLLWFIQGVADKVLVIVIVIRACSSKTYDGLVLLCQNCCATLTLG